MKMSKPVNPVWYPGIICSDPCTCGNKYKRIPCDSCDVPCPKICVCEQNPCICKPPCKAPCPQICKEEERCKCDLSSNAMPCGVCDVPCPQPCVCGKEICVCKLPCSIPCTGICEVDAYIKPNKKLIPCRICTAPCPEKCICLDLKPKICTCLPGTCICPKPKLCDCTACVCQRDQECTCEICLCKKPIVQHPVFGNSPYSFKRIGNRPMNSLDFERTKTKSQNDADDYLKQHYIFEFFHFLLCHILVNMPDNPVTFLLDLFKRILDYRDKGEKPPLLFEERHIEACYRAMDPQGIGAISVNQYILGMTTLGIQYFNRQPFLTDKGLVPKLTFVEEAKQRSIFVLDDIIESKKKIKKPKKEKTSTTKLNEIPL